MLSAAQLSKSTVKLDGSTLEGGGQLLRLAICFSSLTGVPVHVSHIRGKRGALSPTGVGKDGGLKPAHLAAVRWLAEATAAVTEGLEVGSTDLSFKPTRPVLQHEVSYSASTWKDIYLDGQLIRRESHISLSTAGSITLIFQAIFPYVQYFATDVPSCITVEGGTNVSKSPSIDYVSQVLLPILSTKLGIPPVKVKVHKRGWSGGRSEIGSVTFEILPFDTGVTLPAFHFTDQGCLERVHITLIAPANGRQDIKAELFRQLGEAMPEAELLLAVDEDSGHNTQVYLLLVAETSSGFRLGKDCLCGRKAPSKVKKKTGRSLEEQDRRMVSSVIAGLQRELSWGGCVDEYLEDQVVIFQALACGTSKVDAGPGRPASLHTETARWVAKEILGITFHGSKSAGVSFPFIRPSQTPTTEVEESSIQKIGQLSVREP